MSTIQLNLFDSTGSAFTPLAETRSEVRVLKHDVCPLARYAEESSITIEKYIYDCFHEKVDFMAIIPSVKKEFYFVVQVVKGRLKANKRPLPKDKVQNYLHPKFREPIQNTRIKVTERKGCSWDANLCYVGGAK